MAAPKQHGSIVVGPALRAGATSYAPLPKDALAPPSVSRWQRLGGGVLTSVVIAALVGAASVLTLFDMSQTLLTWTVRGVLMLFALVHARAVVRGTAYGHRATCYRIMRADSETPPSYLQALAATVVKMAIGVLTVAWYAPVVLALLPLVDKQRRQLWDVVTRTRPVSV